MLGLLRTISFSMLLPLFIGGCAINKDFFLHEKDEFAQIDTADICHAVYFLGNSDKVKLGRSPTGHLLSRQMEQSGKESTLILLGNNSLRNTSIKLDSSRRGLAKLTLLKYRYDFFNSLKGPYFAVLGPHEWANGSRYGMNNARILEEILDDELQAGDIIRPSGGCPGPDEVKIGSDIVLLLIDTQWLFHSWDKPKEEDGCDAAGKMDFYVNLQDAIKRNYNKKIIVAGYHSLAGNGRHGGYFPAKSHFIPLPVLGSLDIGLRSWLGNPYDMANPNYQVFIKTMKDIFREHKDIIYLSAHEKTLEHHKTDHMHFLNSGSYSQGVEVGQKTAQFASGKSGYGRLLFKKDGDCVLEFWGAGNSTPQLLYQRVLFGDWKMAHDEMMATEEIDFRDLTIASHASDMYTKKQKRPGMLGNNYRKEWTTQVSDIPYFDIGTEKGGLKIVQRGGGLQTQSLRLENKDEKQYVLRSVEKYPQGAVPAELRNTVAADVVTDQISASHPYGAFAIPKMAEAAGIYHTNPRLVYLPDDPRLGIYRQTFGDDLYLFEERPAGNREDVESFGRSKDIVNTAEVLKETRKDGDHYVDQQFALRCRLFDVLIGDWDRHDDQWRWATFRDEDGQKFYRPIPRDRDQAFFWSDGWLLKIASYNWGVAKFQGFHDEIRDIDGLCFNGRYFDRSFLNELNRQQWIDVANDLQDRITDEIIEKSIHDLPPEIFALNGETIIRKLKARRNDLVKYAETYYLFISKNVDVLGSDKSEHFIVERINDEQTRVKVDLLKSTSGEVKRTMYERIFYRSETSEIRLYGFEGDDLFEIRGDVEKGIKIRIIGGKGEDIVNDQSSVQSRYKKTLVHDTKTHTVINSAGHTKILTSDKDPLINDYNRKMFRYNVIAPLLYPSYNPDDGIYIGAGVMIKNQGFRKSPFRHRHVIKADVAPRSQSYDFSYTGTFTETLGKWDIVVNANAFTPSYADYFYGYGNESEFEDDKIEEDHRYYSARYIQYIFYPEIHRKSKNELHHFTIGGGYQSVNVKSDLNDLHSDQDRFIINFANTLAYDLLDVQRHYLAMYGSYKFDNTNSEFMPRQGIKWNLFLIGLQDIDNKEKAVNFQRARTDISYYYTFGRFLRSTLALRVGGVATNGEFEFYHAVKNGGTNTFRGVRKFRFAGQHSFYQNTDMRVELFNIRNPLLPVTVGAVGFHDFSTVWYPNDPSAEEGESDKIHRAYGVGLWLAPLNKISFGIDYSVSTVDEEALFLRMGFFF
jgi:hypothetical protein